MTTPNPGATLTIPDLLRALDVRISEEISLARSAPRSRSPSPRPMVSPLIVICFRDCDLSLTRILQVDELSAGLKRLLVRAEELKNSFQPIQRLPADVIVEVATYLDPRACGGDCQPLMAISQLCRYWREALLSNPESWCFVKSEFLGLVPLFLERSGLYPLEINLTNTWSFYAVGHIRPHAERLAILRCEVDEANATFLRTLSRLNHSPNLHTLSITSVRTPTVAPESIEMAFLSGDMSTLRTLELLPFPVIPQFTQLKHLVNLRIHVTHSTLTAVLDLLAANPSLEKVGLVDNFWSAEDERAAGSTVLGRLKFLSVERCVPRGFLEKLTFPRGARVFIRYNPRFIPPAFALQQPMEGYANMRGLTSLHVLTGPMSDTYLDATGPNGGIAFQLMELLGPSPMCNAITPLPTAGIIRLVCELHPALDVVHIDTFTRLMDVLPNLEEIELVHLGGDDTQEFLSVIRTTSQWTMLRRLKFVHCRRVTDWIVHLIRMALERKGDEMMLDTVTIVYKWERLPGMFERLERAVGTLEVVEESAAEMVRSELVWDDAGYTMRVTSVPVE